MKSQDNRMVYKLIDCGSFQKCEQVGPYVISRPAAQAVWSPKKNPDQWKVDAEFIRLRGGEGQWNFKSTKKNPDPFTIEQDGVRQKVKFTDFGHLGFFAEHVSAWKKLRHSIRSFQKHCVNSELVRVLNLFAYTGGASIACAQEGAECTHVDASKSSVAWGRENLELNTQVPGKIRWIIEDAQKYCVRESKRKSKYEIIVLDPPTYGRGPNREIWDIEKHLIPLLTELKELVDPKKFMVLLSAHSPGYTPVSLLQLLKQQFPMTKYSESSELVVTTESGLLLPAGAYACISTEKIL